LHNERFGFFVGLIGFGLGNSWEKNDSESIKEEVGDTTSGDSGVVETGQIIILKKSFDEIEIDRENQLITEKENGKWPSIVQKLFT
jgi:hypothetical protein